MCYNQPPAPKARLVFYHMQSPLSREKEQKINLDGNPAFLYSPLMMNANGGAKVTTIQKDDIVRSVVMGEFGGNGWVKYILPDGMALVEFPIWGKAYIPVNRLEKVEV